MKKKIIALVLAVAVIATIGGVAIAESNSQPASKATAAVGYINVISAGDPDESTIMTQEIKMTGNNKDLFVDVSLETALFTETVVKSKNMVTDVSGAEARIEVMVQATPIGNDGVPTGAPIIAQPNVIVGYEWDDVDDEWDPVYNGGWVTFDYRLQQLTATLQGFVDSITCEWVEDEWVCTIDPVEAGDEEEIGLLLSTMAAHSFNYILMDLPVGTYKLEVRARVADDTYLGGSELGTASANAFIGLGSVTFETVRMIRGEVIEVVDPPDMPD
jgi:hypothetical protein